MPDQETLVINNAGIVLASSFIPALFNRLQLTDTNHNFLSESAQLQAVSKLQYLATGTITHDERQVPLSKILCGLPVTTAVKNSSEISLQEKTTIDQLIEAIIAYWPSVGSSSVDGFRGNWFVREGTLIAHSDKWELNVQKRPYDILLNKSPFSFSIIHYQWMGKPIHVNWQH